MVRRNLPLLLPHVLFFQTRPPTCSRSLSSRGTHQMVIAFHKRVNIGITDDNILDPVGHQEDYSQLLRIFIGLQMNAIPMSRFQSKRYLRKCHSQIQSQRSNQNHKITTTKKNQCQMTFGNKDFFQHYPTKLPTKHNTHMVL